uniref:Link domain-containing protein n=1 Tax=viral metagenome TaxID=1070528 RepID=A0A6C0LK79_9ZZZZ
MYFAVFVSLGKNGGDSDTTFSGDTSKSGGSNIAGIIIIIILVILIIINAFEYFLNVNISAYVSGFFDPSVKTKHIDIVVNKDNETPPVQEIKFRKQVYNIPGNYYNYENAKAICSAYGSELATYNQIEDAYKNGGEWCNYGWSADQMALYPTQEDTYNNLQDIKGHEHDCGRPGINGGYIANPNVKFGVNCYGNKPKITEEEDDLMKTMTPYPETIEDQMFQKRVDFWKSKVENILVSPFNYNTWGEI